MIDRDDIKELEALSDWGLVHNVVHEYGSRPAIAALDRLMKAHEEYVELVIDNWAQFCWPSDRRSPDG